MNRLLILLAALSAALPVTGARAAGVLRLAHSAISVEGTRPAEKLEVENTGDSPLYLEVSQEWVQVPLGQPEVRLPVGNVPNPSLLVNPPRLVLRPGQKRLLDVTVVRQPREQQIWRVTFRPRERHRVQPIGDPRAQAPILISVGYGVVIYQRGSASAVLPAQET
ncbi:hypothetical protein [Erwinia sp. Leaf53]|uniref:hypothetical protein n=1 Tax=Erwinia sp. Leaf53 TaxID=1736225 RepID=UPI0006F4415C|nr:hypothetical protein [Erwinia sp. Leaf53]KQN60294.1 hypothetical protein ASF13_22430 [Erwinia sp. Leaf53]